MTTNPSCWSTNHEIRIKQTKTSDQKCGYKNSAWVERTSLPLVATWVTHSRSNGVKSRINAPKDSEPLSYINWAYRLPYHCDNNHNNHKHLYFHLPKTRNVQSDTQYKIRRVQLTDRMLKWPLDQLHPLGPNARCNIVWSWSLGYLSLDALPS